MFNAWQSFFGDLFRNNPFYAGAQYRHDAKTDDAADYDVVSRGFQGAVRPTMSEGMFGYLSRLLPSWFGEYEAEVGKGAMDPYDPAVGLQSSSFLANKNLDSILRAAGANEVGRSIRSAGQRFYKPL